MKNFKKLVLSIAALLVVSSSVVYASFPVRNEQKTEQKATDEKTLAGERLTSTQAQISAPETKVQADRTTATNALDEKWILLLLWFFLGGVAAHRWYAKKPIGWNILFIITLGGCGIWALIDLINILTDNF